MNECEGLKDMPTNVVADRQFKHPYAAFVLPTKRPSTKRNKRAGESASPSTSKSPSQHGIWSRRTGYLCLFALGLKNCRVHPIINDNSIPASIHTIAFMTRLTINSPNEIKLNDASQYPTNNNEDGQMKISQVGQAYKPSILRSQPKKNNIGTMTPILPNSHTLLFIQSPS